MRAIQFTLWQAANEGQPLLVFDTEMVRAQQQAWAQQSFVSRLAHDTMSNDAHTIECESEKTIYIYHVDDLKLYPSLAKCSR